MTKQLNLSSLLKDMDILQVERNSLPEHFVAQFDQHTRELYATMLAAIILVDGSVSDNKGRLFNMLLTSLKLEGTQAKMFGQAQAVDRDKLRDFCRVCDEHSIGVSFFADALILCRLDHPIGFAQNQMFSRWVALLNLTEKDVEAAVYVAAAVLGLPSKVSVDERFDFNLVKVWDEFTYLTLDSEILKKGIKSGRWLVDKPLKANFDWTIENTQIVFSSDASISTEGEFSVGIKNSKLTLPRFNFVGLENLSVAESDIGGFYDSKKAITAFFIKNHSGEGELNLLNLKVQTVNARAFYINQNRIKKSFRSQAQTLSNIDSGWEVSNCGHSDQKEKLTNIVVGCEFLNCGHAELIGGALCLSNGSRAHGGDSWSAISAAVDGMLNSKNWYIAKCKFIKCHAILGGGAFFDKTKGGDLMSDCYFEECLSLAYQDNNKPKNWNDMINNGGGFFCLNGGNAHITSCKFIAANVYRGTLSQSELHKKSIFIDSMLSFDGYGYGMGKESSFSQGNFKLRSDCSYDSKISSEDWMNDFEGANFHSLVKSLNQFGG